jgi:hypothetical protein
MRLVAAIIDGLIVAALNEPTPTRSRDVEQVCPGHPGQVLSSPANGLNMPRRETEKRDRNATTDAATLDRRAFLAASGWPQRHF